MKDKKTIVLFLLLLVIAGAALVMYVYNKPHVNVKKADAAYVLTAENLITEYQQDEVKTTEKYSERIIQVAGRVFDISTTKGNSVITLKDENSESSIICHMLPEENAKTLKLEKGQDIAIKGICSGYLMDVMMVRCTLAE